MNYYVIQIIFAFLGTLGFSLLFQVPKKLLFWTSFGGIVSWSVYLSLQYLFGGLFLPYMLLAVAAAIYAEIMARIMKVPMTTFLILALIPAIPGGSLYYTMCSVVSKDWVNAQMNGYNTLQYALAIAVGISIIWAIGGIAARIKKEKKG